jgi:hypothetical protein
MEYGYFSHFGYPGFCEPFVKKEPVACNFCVFGDRCKHPTLERFPKLVEKRIAQKECDQAMGYEYHGTRDVTYSHLVGEGEKYYWHGKFFRYRADEDFIRSEAVLRSENTPILCRECFYNRRGLCTNDIVTRDIVLQIIPLPILMGIFSENGKCLGGSKFDPDSFLNVILGRKSGLKLAKERVVPFSKKDRKNAWGE